MSVIICHLIILDHIKRASCIPKLKQELTKDVSTAEVEVMQSIGAALGHIRKKQTTSSS